MTISKQYSKEKQRDTSIANFDKDHIFTNSNYYVDDIVQKDKHKIIINIVLEFDQTLIAEFKLIKNSDFITLASDRHTIHLFSKHPIDSFRNYKHIIDLMCLLYRNYKTINPIHYKDKIYAKSSNTDFDHNGSLIIYFEELV